jgi:hypothetical protein
MSAAAGERHRNSESVTASPNLNAYHNDPGLHPTLDHAEGCRLNFGEKSVAFYLGDW